MNDDEKASFHEKKAFYYRKEAMNVLKTILPFSKI